MKKVLLSVFFMLTALTINAQEDNKVNVTAGIGASSVVGSDAKTTSAFSYKLGITYDCKVAENFYIVPGLDFVAKGFNSTSIEGRINMSYIQIPVSATYKFSITDNVRVGAHVGPYFSFGIYGSDIELYNGTEFNMFDADLGYKRFDTGVITGINIEFYKFSVGFEYSRGFVKLDPNYSQFNQTIGVAFGYYF